MSTRTTTKQLEAQLRILNSFLNRPVEPYTDSKANVGNLCLDHNIGGYQIQEIVNEGGGVTCPLGDHRHTAGDMWHVLRAAIGAVGLARK